ncbi:MAG TPA: hypothetical protein EYG70_03770 [Sulfurimonas sp.]|nr:hypothetical protein [Sulfurimonas sp.]
MNTEKNEEIKVLASMLFEEYKSLTVSTDIVAEITQRSKVSLDRDRAEGIGIPCSKLGKGSGSDRVLYNIYDIAKFIVGRKMKVAS